MSVQRIGLIVPSSNTVMEPDFHRHAGSSAIISTTRIFLESVTREAELRMLADELPRAIDLIRTTAADVVVFGCTSAGALGTLAHDDAIAATIARDTGANVVTVLGAVLTRLRAIAARRVAVFTPYVQDLTDGVASSLAEAGFEPVSPVGMGIRENLAIGRVTPPEIVRFVESRKEGSAPDCIFLSCTNWRAMEAVDALERKFGVPIVTSNQAALQVVMERSASAP